MSGNNNDRLSRIMSAGVAGAALGVAEAGRLSPSKEYYELKTRIHDRLLDTV
ncbi:MAG: hypothetical protein H6Q92_1219, partial [Nitrospirae bacterium]|nr:hypothetical protein [Nitrospirota bacterium]